MHTGSRRMGMAILLILILLIAAGCFQTAGEGLQATSVAQSVATFTPPPTITPADLPTEELTPEVTPEAVDALPTEEATPEVFPTATETPLTIGQVPTETPTGDLSASVNGQVVDDPALTATAIIASATARAEATNIALTQQVIQPTPTTSFEQIFPTLTPTVDPNLNQGGGGNNLVPGVDCEHQVRVGDNLFRISLYYGLTIDQIAQRNGITNINLIIVGRKLVIPGCGTTGNPPPPTTIPGPGPGPGQTHLVQQGDNLFRISLRYGVPIASIAAANGIANINLIYIGQVLVIPG